MLGLLDGTFCKQSSTKSLKYLLHDLLVPRAGGGPFIMERITFIAGRSENGAWPWASSIAVTPTDQISAV